MPRWALALCLVLLLGTALGKRGGSKSSSKSGSKSSGSSYPKQQWTNPNNRDGQGNSKTPSAPPGYPNQNPGNQGYPNQNPGYPSYPSYPNHNAPPPYSAPGHPYGAPPAYSAPGHAYPAPPGYPTGHSVPGYPNYPAGGVPVHPGSAKPGKIGKTGGVGTHLGAAALGAVAGAAIAHSVSGPKIKIHMPGHHYHGGHYHDGYSSSEEYFNPYITGPNGSPRGDFGGLHLNELSPEERQIVQLAQAMVGLCDKLRQPSVCTLLKMHGLRPFTHPNSMFRNPEPNQNFTHQEDNNIVPVGPVVPNLNGTVAFEGQPLWPTLPKESPKPMSLTTVNVTSPPITTHLNEERLKAAEDLFKVLD